MSDLLTTCRLSKREFYRQCLPTLISSRKRPPHGVFYSSLRLLENLAASGQLHNPAGSSSSEVVQVASFTSETLQVVPDFPYLDEPAPSRTVRLSMPNGTHVEFESADPDRLIMDLFKHQGGGAMKLDFADYRVTIAIVSVDLRAGYVRLSAIASCLTNIDVDQGRISRCLSTARSTLRHARFTQAVIDLLLLSDQLRALRSQETSAGRGLPRKGRGDARHAPPLAQDHGHEPRTEPT